MLVNIHEAKTHFSKLINQALKGEQIIIAKGGKPLIQLTPYTKEMDVRHGGQFQGLMQVSADFDEPLPEEILKYFYGSDE